MINIEINWKYQVKIGKGLGIYKKNEKTLFDVFDKVTIW